MIWKLLFKDTVETGYFSVSRNKVPYNFFPHPAKWNMSALSITIMKLYLIKNNRPAVGTFSSLVSCNGKCYTFMKSGMMSFKLSWKHFTNFIQNITFSYFLICVVETQLFHTDYSNVRPFPTRLIWHTHFWPTSDTGLDGHQE